MKSLVEGNAHLPIVSWFKAWLLPFTIVILMNVSTLSSQNFNLLHLNGLRTT
jgi:hypothetical protein